MNLKRKMQRAQARKPFNKQAGMVKVPPPREVDYEAVFCDCYGTLYSHSFEKDELLVQYLNALHDDGVDVVLFTTNISQVYQPIQDIGLKPQILRTLQDKRRFYGAHLQEWIDDDPIPLISAQKLWKPQSPEFMAHIKAYLESRVTKPGPDLAV